MYQVPEMISLRKLRICFVAVSLMLLGNLTTSSLRADVLELNMAMTGTVNGEPIDAQFSGAMGDSSTGTATVNWQINAMPTGYNVFGSVYFNASSLIHMIAQEAGGAANLLTLSGGNYSVVSTATFPGGEEVVVNMDIQTQGSVVTCAAVFSGAVVLPPLVGVNPGAPAVWTPGPGSNQFTETFTKFLIRQDGGPDMETQNNRVYTLPIGMSLSQTQFRTLELAVTDSVPDIANPTTSTVAYFDQVSFGDVIPTVSEWSLIVMTVLAFTVGTILYGRRRCARRAA